jgi:ribosomal protein S18 acetylase RimI-like enzyme
MIQLPADHPLDLSLAERRWAVRPGAAIVMTASPSSAPLSSAPLSSAPLSSAPLSSAPLSSAPLSSVPVSDVRFDPSPDDAWLARYNYRGSSIPPIAKTVLMSAPEQYFASIRDLSGAAIAIARLSLDAAGSPHADSRGEGSPHAGSPHAGSPDDGAAPRLAGITAVEVDPAYRRRGLGSAITRAVCTEAARRGADLVFLQTEVTNAPARALYEALGFHPSHTYHYRIAP